MFLELQPSCFVQSPMSVGFDPKKQSQASVTQHNGWITVSLVVIFQFQSLKTQTETPVSDVKNGLIMCITWHYNKIVYRQKVKTVA